MGQQSNFDKNKLVVMKQLSKGGYGCDYDATYELSYCQDTIEQGK